MPTYDPNTDGRARKVNDLVGTFRIDTYLTQFSIQYRQAAENFVGGFAATPVPVAHESDKYAIYPQGYFWRDEAKVRPLGGRPVQANYKVTYGQYLAEEWALEHTIDDRQRANTDNMFDLDENAVMLLEGKQMIREDAIWAANFFGAGLWTQDYEGGVDFTPFNDAASTPIEFIDTVKTTMAQTTGMMPNTIVLGANVHNALRSNADIIDRVKYTQKGIANHALLAELFEVDNVRTARAVYNAGKEGGADDLEFIVDPNGMWIGYVEPTARLNAPTAIARFGWTGLLGGGANQAGGVVTRGRDDRASSDWIQSHNAFEYKQVSADLGAWLGYANAPSSN